MSEKLLGVTDTISLGLRKREGETWLDAALRMAKPYGLEHEIRTWYGYAIENGRPEDEAAWSACYEWDVLELRQGGTSIAISQPVASQGSATTDE